MLGHTLYSVPDVVKLNHGQPTMTFAQVVKASKSLPAPARPIPPPETLPPPGPVLLPDDRAGFLGEGWVAPVDLNSAELGGYRQTPPTCFSPSERTSTDVPMLESLALPVDELDSTIPAGEQAALDRLRRLCADPGWVAGFAKPKSSPALAVEDFLEGEMYRGESQGGQGSGKKEKGGGGSTFVLSPFLKCVHPLPCLPVKRGSVDPLALTGLAVSPFASSTTTRPTRSQLTRHRKSKVQRLISSATRNLPAKTRLTQTVLLRSRSRRSRRTSTVS